MLGEKGHDRLSYFVAGQAVAGQHFGVDLPTSAGYFNLLPFSVMGHFARDPFG
jgi:hypothetical protein